MINFIIKRDGTKEPFQAEKINGWGIWAAKTLSNRVDWGTVVMRTVASLPEMCESAELQNALIRQCLNMNSYAYNRMAGRLYASVMRKEIFGTAKMPTLKQVHTNLIEAGFMTPLGYSDEEYEELQQVIDHSRDFTYAHFQLHCMRYKYALRNRSTNTELETPQFIFMRMAMALGTDQPKERRLSDVKAWYKYFSKNIINAPTPNYINLGTRLNGYASCCLYAVADTIESLAVGDHIAYKMTANAAGIGNNLMLRSAKDPIRGGLILHQGKLPYLRAMYGAVQANKQNGRSGACTSYYSAYDPDVSDLLVLKNPMTPADKQIRGMDYAQMSNKFMGRKAARNEDVMLFNSFTAPDLYEAMYSGDEVLFEQLYAKYETDSKFKKIYKPAREIILGMLNEAFETGRAYFADIGEINRHTPFKDPIRSSNLCAEVQEPTEPYFDMRDLYTEGPTGYVTLKFRALTGSLTHIETFKAVDPVKRVDNTWCAYQNLKENDSFFALSDSGHTFPAIVVEVVESKKEPEVAMCSLAALVVSNIHSDEEYEEAAYYALLMIDKCIHLSGYPLPHIGYTAKNRLSAGIGITDLAGYLAKRNLKYTTLEGKQEIHRVAEKHSYYAIRASLRLGKELGNAPWMHRTKWIDGWLPIDSANRNIDKLVPCELQYDWEELRSQIKENKGIRNSVLIAHMPVESSSKASGGCNALYPARDLTLMKTDNDITAYWAATDSDLLGDQYELAWDVPTSDLIECYGIVQKFTDQGISADLYRRIGAGEKISSEEMLQTYFHMLRVGMKTRYYQNTKTSGKIVLKQSTDHVHVETKLVSAPATTHSTFDWTAAAQVAEASGETASLLSTDDAVYNTGDEERGCAGGACSL